MDKQKSLDTLFSFIFSHNNHSNNDYNNDLLLKQRVFNLNFKDILKIFLFGQILKNLWCRTGDNHCKIMQN
jgi:hypothetical protein